MKKIVYFALDLLTLSVLVGLALGISYLMFIWSGYPTGVDAPQHLYRARVIQEFFPNYIWLHTWAGGIPHFMWYPSVPYFIIWFVTLVSRQSLEFSLTLTAVLSIAIVSWTLYLIVKRVTGSWGAGILSAILFLTSISPWQMLYSAIISRTITFSFFGFFVLWLVSYLKRFTKLSYVLATVFLGLTFLGHPVMGLFASGTCLIVGIFVLGWKDGLKAFLKIVLPGYLLSFPLMLPSLFKSGFKIGVDFNSVPSVLSSFGTLFYWHQRSSGYFPLWHVVLSFPVLTSLVVLGLIALFFCRRELLAEKWRLNFILAFAAIAASTVAFSLVAIPGMTVFYNDITTPEYVLWTTPFYVAVAVGCLWSIVWRKGWIINLLAIPICGLLVWTTVLQFPLSAKNYYARFEPRRDQNFVSDIVKENVPSQEFNFRFGTGNYSYWASWFNNILPFVPQTREYFYMDIVNPDQYFYQVKTAWADRNNDKATEFVLNWWGVKNFIAGLKDDPPLDLKFEGKDDYKKIGEFINRPPNPPIQGSKSEDQIALFEYQRAAPILASTNTPSALLITGKSDSFNFVFQALSFTDIDSSKIIPVLGQSKFIDDYSLEELSAFDEVILYENYAARNKKVTADLLKKYVESGGGLLIEAPREPAGLDLGLLPMADIEVKETAGWDLTSQDYEDLSIDPTKLAPATYGGSPWKIAQGIVKRGNAQTLLSQGGKAVLVVEKLGGGKVIWSGLNFPFHIVNHTSDYESLLLGDLLLWLSKEKPPANISFPDNSSLIYNTDSFVAKFINPERMEVDLKEPARGVLFKENWFTNWNAYLNGKKVRIYKAGPSFMYIPLAGSKKGDRVEFVFGTQLSQVVGNSVAVLTLVFLIFYLFSFRIPGFGGNFAGNAKMLGRRISEWWGKEEE